MTERNGYYQTRYPVPDEHRHLFPELTGKQAVKVIAIGPIEGKKRPHKVQLEKHSDNLDQIEARVKPSLSVSPLPATQDVGRLYHPNEVLDGTEAWAVKEVRQRLLRYSNGVVPLIKPLSSEHAKASARLLWFGKCAKPTGFHMNPIFRLFMKLIVSGWFQNLDWRWPLKELSLVQNLTNYGTSHIPSAHRGLRSCVPIFPRPHAMTGRFYAGG